MKENVYIPPKTRTTVPPIDHLRTRPDFFHINDEDRKAFFDVFNKPLIDRIRSIRRL